MSLSLWAWWPEGRSSSSVSQFLPSCSGSAYQMAVKWRDVTREIRVLDDFSSSAFAASEVDFLQRSQTLRCAQLSAQLSAELFSPDWSCFHTTLRCTGSIHFLWPLNRTFSGLLVGPWISSVVADCTVFAWLSWPNNKTKNILKCFTLHVMNLKYMIVSLFETSYNKKLTFSPYSNLMY